MSALPVLALSALLDTQLLPLALYLLGELIPVLLFSSVIGRRLLWACLIFGGLLAIHGAFLGGGHYDLSDCCVGRGGTQLREYGFFRCDLFLDPTWVPVIF